MTIVVTIEWFIYLYWVLEWYVYTLALELKVKSYYEYHEQMAMQEKEDCSQQNIFVPLHSTLDSAETVVEPILVSKPELDTAAEELLGELIEDLGLQAELSSETIQDSQNEEEFDVYLAYTDDAFLDTDVYLVEEDYETQQDEDCIYLDDLLSEEQSVSPTGYEKFASAKIIDGLDGAQQWVITIVGAEESYIHVSDGKRLWVNVGEYAASLRIGDVLKLDVIRNGKDVTVKNLFLLETDTSADYIIPDEHFSHQYSQDYAVAI